MKAKRLSSGSKLSFALLAFLVLAGILFSLNKMLAMAQPSGGASAEEAASSQQVHPLRGMEERVSLDLRSTEAGDALKYLATKGGLNLALSKNVGGRVNLYLNDVPIRDVFDLILRSNELAYDKQGDVYNVVTEAEYRALYGRKFSDLRKVKTFRLRYAVPQQAFNLLDTLKSEIGRLLVDEESGTVLVMDTPERLEKMFEALATMEQRGTVRVFDLKYAKAKDVEERLKERVESNKLGYVKADERSNQIIVKTLPDRLKEIEQLITALDRKTREVLITAKIVKVNLSNKLNSGIDWNSVFSNLKFHGMDAGPTGGTGSFRTTTVGTAPTEVPAVRRVASIDKGATIFGEKVALGKLLFRTISTDGYELFRYLETIGQTKVISNPRLLVTEGQEARIHVGTREAYVETTTTTGQTTSTTAEKVDFIDVGIQLSVTPFINSDGYVTMKIKPEVSSVVRTLITPSKSQIPIIDTSTAETNVLVKDGSTVIIGGLRKSQKQFENNQIPILGRIPIVGEFFRQRNKGDELQELVVFITPQIINGDELVTGDEGTFGGTIKDFRNYTPVIDSSPPNEIRPEVPSSTSELPTTQRETSGGGFHLKEHLRSYPGNNELP